MLLSVRNAYMQTYSLADITLQLPHSLTPSHHDVKVTPSQMISSTWGREVLLPSWSSRWLSLDLHIFHCESSDELPLLKINLPAPENKLVCSAVCRHFVLSDQTRLKNKNLASAFILNTQKYKINASE